MIYFYAFLCILAIASGQLLFKTTAHELNQSASFINFQALLYFGAAVALYGITSVGWVLILRKIELGRIYPFMALSFLLVPLGSYIFFNERFHTSYYIGVIFIIIGILIVVRN